MKNKKHKLEKQIVIFLSSGLFAFAGLGAADVYAAAVFTDGTNTNSSVAGTDNTASGESSNAFGFNNKADKEKSQAFGADNNAEGLNANAFGGQNTVSGNYASAFGVQNTASGNYANSFGFHNESDGNLASAFGNNNSALSQSSSAFGVMNKSSAAYTSTFGYGNIASGYVGSAIGSMNVSSGDYSSAFGHKNNASKDYASAVGSQNSAASISSNAFGLKNSVSGSSSNAFGSNNNVTGYETNAFGAGNKAAGNKSTAVGNGNNIAIDVEDAFALGNNTDISLSGSVALGSNSVAAAINSVIGNSSYTKWAGVSDVVGVVSVGSSGATRQIQNVAAGQISATSTDAVNGSQLYELAQKVNQQATVSAGDSNVVVTSTTNSSGDTDYEVKLADELEIGTVVKVDGTGDGKIDVGNGNVVIDGSDSSVTAGGVTVNKDNEGTINGLTNTTWDPDNYVSGQAATEDQLKAIHDKASEAIEKAGKLPTLAAVDNNIVITKSTNSDGGDHHELKLNDVVEIGSGANKVTVDGNNGIINTGSININGSNGTIVADKITINGSSGTIGGLTNTTWDPGNITSGQAASEDQLKVVHDTAVKYEVDGSGNINKNKIKLEGSGGTIIGNVAAGEVSATSMDAVNGSQLYQVSQEITNISHDITRLGDEIDTVGALSAAMAGLHPRFQDGNKGELAMAYGGYGGKNALAVGGFYAPNEKVMFSLGLGYSQGGKTMGNFGINFALDRSKKREEAPRDIIYTRKEVDSTLAEQNRMIQLLLDQLAAQQQEINNLKEKIK